MKTIEEICNRRILIWNANTPETSWYVHEIKDGIYVKNEIMRVVDYVMWS